MGNILGFITDGPGGGRVRIKPGVNTKRKLNILRNVNWETTSENSENKPLA